MEDLTNASQRKKNVSLMCFLNGIFFCFEHLYQVRIILNWKLMLRSRHGGTRNT